MPSLSTLLLAGGVVAVGYVAFNQSSPADDVSLEPEVGAKMPKAVWNSRTKKVRSLTYPQIEYGIEGATSRVEAIRLVLNPTDDEFIQIGNKRAAFFMANPQKIQDWLKTMTPAAKDFYTYADNQRVQDLVASLIGRYEPANSAPLGTPSPLGLGTVAFGGSNPPPISYSPPPASQSGLTTALVDMAAYGRPGFSWNRQNHEIHEWQSGAQYGSANSPELAVAVIDQLYYGVGGSDGSTGGGRGGT